jgi:hypothetical protein
LCSIRDSRSARFDSGKAPSNNMADLVKIY